ncbi:MAG TPA: hypothetical protein VEA80_18565 [Vitreimonas sp.]|nr:hypothetical protein [Vitreimonas sp.]
MCAALAIAFAPMAASAQAAAEPKAAATTTTGGGFWTQQPSGADLERHYPFFALFFGVRGRAVLLCVVQRDGSLADCDIESEEPEGWGFGQAAAEITRYFRADPRLAGGYVRAPVRFEVAE